MASERRTTSRAERSGDRYDPRRCAAFVTTSLCCPSRTGILTGEYSRHTGVYDGTTRPPHGGAEAFDDRSSLATWIHYGGYRTALVGKYLNGYAGVGPASVPPGWDEW